MAVVLFYSGLGDEKAEGEPLREVKLLGAQGSSPHTVEANHAVFGPYRI